MPFEEISPPRVRIQGEGAYPEHHEQNPNKKINKQTSIFMSNIGFFCIPKDMELEIIGKHSSCSEHISYWYLAEDTHFGQRMIYRLENTIIFPEIFSLKCQFDNLAETYIILLFTNTYYLMNPNSMLIPNLWYVFIQRPHINHKKCRLGRHSAPGRRFYAR